MSKKKRQTKPEAWNAPPFWKRVPEFDGVEMRRLRATTPFKDVLAAQAMCKAMEHHEWHHVISAIPWPSGDKTVFLFCTRCMKLKTIIVMKDELDED